MGAGSYLDVQNFCCPDYLVTMLQLIQGNWNARQQVSGETMVMFRIQRDGRLTDIELERSSGYPALDLTAQRALFLTQRVPPLPSAFPDDHLTVHLRFEYQTVTMRIMRAMTCAGAVIVACAALTPWPGAAAGRRGRPSSSRRSS